MRAPAIVAGAVAGVLLSLAGVVFASPGMGSIGGGAGAGLADNNTWTGTQTYSAQPVFSEGAAIANNKKLDMDGAGGATHVKTNAAGQMEFTVATGDYFAFFVNTTAEMTVRSDGVAFSNSGDERISATAGALQYLDGSANSVDGHVFDGDTTKTTGDLMVVKNNTVEKYVLDKDGKITIQAGIQAAGAIATSSGDITSTNGALNARATLYGHVALLQDQYGGATQAYLMTAKPADGATAFNVNTEIQGGDNPLTSGNIMKWMNDDVNQATVDYGGRIQINMAGNAEPTCDSGRRGMLSITQSAGGSGDIVRACLKGTDDNYAWRSVFTAP